MFDTNASDTVLGTIPDKISESPINRYEVSQIMCNLMNFCENILK